MRDKSGSKISRMKGLNIRAGERSRPAGGSISVPFPQRMKDMQMRCKTLHKQVRIIWKVTTDTFGNWAADGKV